MKNLFDLKGKVVLVTGGTGQLGSSYSSILAEHGASVVIADISEEKCLALAEGLNTKFNTNSSGFKCDLTLEKDIKSTFSFIEDKYGKLDSIINNAAATGEYLQKKGSVFADFEDYSLDLWNEVLNINLTGVFLICREGGKMMKKQSSGSIINVSSMYGVVGPDHQIYEGMSFKSFAAYSASKAGVHGLTQWLATYWGPNNIRVNTLVPGGVQNDSHDPIFVQRYSKRTPLRRMARKEDMLGVVLYLVSDSSSYSTGQKFYVDGGWTAQ